LPGGQRVLHCLVLTEQHLDFGDPLFAGI